MINYEIKNFFKALFETSIMFLAAIFFVMALSAFAEKPKQRDFDKAMMKKVHKRDITRREK